MVTLFLLVTLVLVGLVYWLLFDDAEGEWRWSSRETFFSVLAGTILVGAGIALLAPGVYLLFGLVTACLIALLCWLVYWCVPSESWPDFIGKHLFFGLAVFILAGCVAVGLLRPSLFAVFVFFSLSMFGLVFWVVFQHLAERGEIRFTPWQSFFAMAVLIAAIGAAVILATRELPPEPVRTEEAAPTVNHVVVKPAHPLPSLEERAQAALLEVLAQETITDAAWEDGPGGNLLAGAWDNGSERSALAAESCAILARHGFTGGQVRILAQKPALALRADWREIGKAKCRK